MIKQSCVFVLIAIGISLNACASQSTGEISIIDTTSTEGKVYTIANAGELHALKLVAGDKVVLKAGIWNNQGLNFKAMGTESKPISLAAESGGEVVLSGNSNLKIDGEWLIVDGLSFKNGYSLRDDVISFSKTSSNCRLTNTSIENYNPPAKETDYKWISLYGTHHRVDHCSVVGKTHAGTTVVVWLDEKPNYHQIDHNYFGPRPPLGVNGGETIRIGTSTWSMHDSYTTIEENIFDKCDGEIEIISIKSGHNVIRNNLFYECEGTVTFRHGNHSAVRDNYFIGNNKPDAGGVRLIGENQQVSGNYFYHLPGRSLRAAISVMNAYQEPALSDYWQVKDAVIDSNIIVACREAFVLGAGKDNKRTVAPDGLSIVSNYIIDPIQLLVRQDQPSNLVLQNNQLKGAALEGGFVPMGTDLKMYDGIWQNKNTMKTLFWRNTHIGPGWIKEKRSFVLK